MPNILTIIAEDPAELLNAGAYGAGAIIRVQTSATETGVYADVTGTGSTPTLAIVSTVTSYTAYDPAGALSSWYRTRYESAGGVRVSDWSDAFQVGSSTAAYVSLAMFRTYLRNQSPAATDADSDVELLALQAAARAIDRECGRQFRAASGLSTRTFQVGKSTSAMGWPYYMYRRYAVDVDDFFDATSMTVAFDATGNGSYTSTTTAFRVMPANAPSKGMPYTSLLFDIGTIPPPFALNPDGVQVTANWGWNEIPSSVVNANLIQASRFLKRRDSPFGVAGSPELGNELRLLSKLDPDVALLLRSYKLDWGNI